MNKKSIILLVIILLGISIVLLISNYNKKQNTNYELLLNNNNYSSIKLDNIKEIVITEYTEGGDSSNTYTSKEDINRIYNSFKNKKIGPKTNIATEDFTTIYNFILLDNSNVIIEIEKNDTLVLNNNRYILK